ncbi:MAG: hypothetical protein ACRBCS_10000 [Cellvibrionaceae bacterium]
MLKPQDTLLLLKHWSMHRSDQCLSMRDLQDSIGISASEVSKGAKRLQAARLLVRHDKGLFAEQNALLEWLSYGIRYAYSPKKSGYGRGMPTAWNCHLVKSDILPPSPAMIWQQARGEVEGVFVEPIYHSVLLAASNDPLLYQILALVDAVRLGKPRELTIARELLKKLIKGN